MRTQLFFFYPHILDNLQLPETGFDVCQDMADKRLRLYVTARGAKTFFVRKRVRGKDTRLILGNYPDISIDEAREMIDKVLSEASAPPPAKQRRMLFSRAAKNFMAEKINRAPRSLAKLERTISRLWAPLMSKHLDEIQADELLQLHKKIAENNGHATANRMREILKSLFNFAMSKNWVNANPVATVAPVAENRRVSNLNMEGLKRIMSKIKREKDPVIRRAFLMLIFGFMKKSEVFSMSWDDLDLRHDFYKTTPLTNKAIALLNDTPQTGNWVFPNGRGGHITDPRSSWKHVTEAANLPGIQINDCIRLLRRQLKWSNQADILRDNMNAVLEKLG